MHLEFESGVMIDSPEEADVSRIEGEEFAILSTSGHTYIQCAEMGEAPWGYVLEYQDGSLEQHYEATDHPITLERVLAAFKKYLNADPTWRDDFQWQKMDL